MCREFRFPAQKSRFFIRNRPEIIDTRKILCYNGIWYHAYRGNVLPSVIFTDSHFYRISYGKNYRISYGNFFRPTLEIIRYSEYYYRYGASRERNLICYQKNITYEYR